MIIKRDFSKKRYITTILVSTILITVLIFILRIVKRDCNRDFAKPIDVEWEGEVIANMLGGTAYGVKRIPPDKKYPLFYAGPTEENIDKLLSENKNLGLEGKVRVKGRWVGITDAYKNTIFGSCVPDVIIEFIEPLNN